MSESVTQQEKPQQWTTVIGPEQPWFNLRWKELWQYRDLIGLFAHRDITTTHKQTILGPLWFVFQPLLTTVVFTILFQKVAKVRTDGLPPFLFNMCGVVAWSYFANCLTRTASTFASNAGTFSKVYFPRLSVPISIVLSNLVTFGIQFVFFLAFMVYYYFHGAELHPTWRVLITPLLVIQMAALGLGVGAMVAALTTRYRDLQMLVSFGVQFWMYGSCVVYPLSVVSKHLRIWFILNPMVPIIEALRFSFLGQGIIEGWHLMIGFTVSVAIFFGGIILFCRVERTFSDEA
jgi:lipopolysaccharide transport system permease protein